MRTFLFLALLISSWVFLAGSVCCQRPAVVNIGAVFAFDSVIGRAARVMMNAAVADINADPTVLNGTKLNLVMENGKCNAFLGSMEVFQLLEHEVVAVIGPQSSVIAHLMSQIANGLQMPLISYAATDPTLSSLQFPYFFRTTQSDSYQMAAMAELIDFYGWKEVIAIFVDDDYGRNGIAALDDELNKKMTKISYKLPLPPQFNLSEVKDLLKKSQSFGPRVYVVHLQIDPRLTIFMAIHELQMMTRNYVWLVTDWLSTTLLSISPVNQSSLDILQGVVTLRQHTAESKKKTASWSHLNKILMEGSNGSLENGYAPFAYDTVWVVAHAIDKYLKTHGNFTFSFNNATASVVGKLKTFDNGALLRSILLQTNFTGVAGQVQFDSDRNLVGGGYDVMNVNKGAVNVVGYWSNFSGFSVLPPETLNDQQNGYSRLNQELNNITWPGGKTERPRGWVIAVDEKPLRIGVPKRASFVEFVTEQNNSHQIRGYCIDVFQEALKFVPYHVPYMFVPFGNGFANPDYNALVENVADGVIDAAVGDIAIVTNRTRSADFSQPYAATGLVIVAPIRSSKSTTWVFLKPFTLEMWCVTAASFVLIGVVIWILEHRVNDDFRGPPKRQIVTVFLFSFSTLFKTNQENTISPLSRLVMVVWLFLLMVITSSYTASLTSILTVQQLSSPIRGIDDLIASNSPIGFQVGSFAYSYLTQSLYVPGSRLVALGSPEEYERALRQGPSRGGVAAIIDELPYVELFLSKTTDFGIIGQPFTKSGWGFAFRKESPLALDLSTAILKLSENGELQKIHEQWFCKMGCPGDRRPKSEPNQLHLFSFWGLYILCGSSSLAALLVFLVRTVCQFRRYKKRQQGDPSHSSSSVSSNTSCHQVIHHFIDFVDEKEESIKKIFRQTEAPQNHAVSST